MDAAMPKPWMLPGETWLPIPSYEGFYEASDFGRVHSLDRDITRSDGRPRSLQGKLLTERSHTAGYPVVNLCREGTSRLWYIHRLVLLTFVGPCPDGWVTRHLDGNSMNARLDNLAYGTPSENMYDKTTHGTNPHVLRTHCPYKHELRWPNLREAALPHRICLACTRTRPWIAQCEARGVFLDHQTVSDEKYADIMAGRLRRRVGDEACRFGHPLAPPNLATWAKGLQCLACCRANSSVYYWRTQGVELDFKAVADAKYAEIVRQAEPA